MSASRPGDDAARFLHELRELRDLAGLGPAELAARAHYPVDVLQAAETGPALPDLPVLAAYVRGCGGTPAEWEERWRSLTRAAAESSTGLPTRQGGSSTAAAAGARAGTTTAPPEDHDPARIMAALSRDAAEPTRPARERTSGGAHRAPSAPSVAHANGNSVAAFGQPGAAAPPSSSPFPSAPAGPELPETKLPETELPETELPPATDLTSPAAASSGSWFAASGTSGTTGTTATNPPADEAPQAAPRTSPSPFTPAGVPAAGARSGTGYGDAGYTDRGFGDRVYGDTGDRGYGDTGDRGYGDAGYRGSGPADTGYRNAGRAAATSPATPGPSRATAASSRATAATAPPSGAQPSTSTAPAEHQATGRRVLSREAAIALIVVATLAFVGILLAVLP